MSPSPAVAVVADVLTRVDPAAAERFCQPNPETPTATVNGIAVPIVRIGWQHVGRFYGELFASANDRLFNGRLPACRLSWNRRFRNLGGRIDCRQNLIELSSAHFEACGAPALGIVLIHEQIHLSLSTDHLSSGHTPEFKRRSLALGLPSIHHAMPLPQRLRRPRRVHVYRCACGKEVQSRVRFRQPRACAACCRRHANGRFDRRFLLEYIGAEVRDTAERPTTNDQ